MIVSLAEIRPKRWMVAGPLLTAETARSGRGGPAITLKLAVAWWPPSSPVTVWGPTIEAVHVAPTQEPSGLIENVVAPVTSPRGFSNESNPCAWYVWLPPTVVV